MTIFHSARIRLTAWYLLIILLVSLSFSLGLYRLLTNEVDRFVHLQRLRLERRTSVGMLIQISPDSQPPTPPKLLFDPDLVTEVHQRVAFSLILINATIVVLAGGLGYFLAGHTLQPISQMVKKQRQFISDASHELRTPLTALKSSLEVHLRDKKLQVKDARTLLSQNLEDVNRLQHLTESLLQLSQYETESLPKSFVAVELSTCVQNAVEQLQPKFQEKHIQFQLTLKPARVWGDAAGIQQVLVILLDNAIKYSKTRGFVELEVIPLEKGALVRVTDHGIGISPTDQVHVFDRFYRAETARTHSDKNGSCNGYGLGLAIAQQIITAHRGSIKVKSIVEQGSTFEVRLV